MKKISKRLLSMLIAVVMLLSMCVVGYAQEEELCLVVSITKGGYVSNLEIVVELGYLSVTAYSIQNETFETGDVIKIPMNDTSMYNIFSGFFVDAEGWNSYASVKFVGGSNLSYSYVFKYTTVEIVKTYPSGYNLNDDRLGFPNPKKVIEDEIYKKGYGNVKGWCMYQLHENGKAHGLCYGMAAVTSALLQNRSAINSFSSYNGGYVKSMSEIYQDAFSNIFNIDILTYVKYGFIYQYSSDTSDYRESTEGDLNGLYTAVKNYVNGNGDGVVISLWNKNGLFKENGHGVYAVGLKESLNEIIIFIDDSNFHGTIRELTISKDFSSWSYMDYNSSNGIISYDMPGDVIYNVGLQIGCDARAVPTYMSQSNLLVASTNELSADSELVEINSTSGDDETDNINAYWLNDGLNSVTLTSEENSEITVSDVNSSVSAAISANADAQFNVDDDGINSVTYESNANDNAVITFVTADNDGNLITTTITGTASGSEVVATEIDNGVQVTGLNNITVTYEAADGTGTASANITDGRTMNIVVDASNSVEFDWNCSHLCHSTNGFVQFIWKIVKFIYRIFGMNQCCDCGMAHW